MKAGEGRGAGGKNKREIKYHKASKQLKRTILFTDMGVLV
jgi:hypothetical protein